MPRRIPPSGTGVSRSIVGAGRRAAATTSQDFGRVVERMRRERGLSQRAVAVACGVDRATIAHLEAGDPHVSLELRARVAAAVGGRARLTLTEAIDGPLLRDRLHAAMHEDLVRLLSSRWELFVDRPVNHAGVRGSIDLVLVDRISRVVAVVEVKSVLVSVEELIRRSGERTAALIGGGTVGLPVAEIAGSHVCEVVVLRDTCMNRRIVRGHAAYLGAAFPGSERAAIVAPREDPASLPDRALVWLAAGPRPGAGRPT